MATHKSWDDCSVEELRMAFPPIDIDDIDRVTRTPACNHRPGGLRYVPRSAPELESIIAKVGMIFETGHAVPAGSRDIITFLFRGMGYHLDVGSAREELRARRIRELGPQD